MLTARQVPTTLAETPVLTVGCTLEIIKGMRDAWATHADRPGMYLTINVREHWNVKTINDTRIVITRGGRNVVLYVSSLAKTRHPEFNLNSGDPTKTIRVCVVKRSPEAV